MNTAYDRAVLRLNEAVARRGIHYSLDRFRVFLESLGAPHRQLPPCIHIAGTNGKGSTLTYLKAALMKLGLTVGTYTSPHIIDYTERICINGIPIPKDDFVRLLNETTTPELVVSSEFEILTAMAFRYFSRTRPDVVIVETGMGGRLDATNVIDPILSVITPVGLDHQAILGNTIQEIAGEKAGIIKPNCPVVSAVQVPDAAAVIAKAASENRAQLTIAEPISIIPPNHRMQADYQKSNIAVAQAALTQLRKIAPPEWNTGTWSDDVIQAGLAEAEIWGRFSRYQTATGQTIVIDGAHNVHGFSALSKAMHTAYPGRSVSLWIGMLAVKSVSESLAAFTVPVTDWRIYCPDPIRWHPPAAFGQSDRLICNDAGAPFESIGSELVLITGSLYFIAMFRDRFVTMPFL